MSQVRLFRLASKHKHNLRTPFAQGVTDQEPTVGQEFLLVCPALIEGAHARLIHTTPIKEIRRQIDGSMEFDTANSTYLYQPVTGNEKIQ